MMRPRFSLRGVLILTAIVAVFCGWRDRPRQVAKRFVAALEAKDQAALERLIVDHARFERMLRILQNAASEGTAQREGQTFAEWLKGQCRVQFTIDGAGNLPDFQGLATAFSTSVAIQSVARSGGIFIHVR
jgi:hypothetical protein